VYAVTVRDHVMIAHSLPRPVFGPAQGLHGATYVVEATFRRRELDDDGIVVDIGAASAALNQALNELRYRNLDEHPAFRDVVTSTEVLTRWVADRLAESPVTEALDGLEVVLRESPDAWASYTRDR
jgi:6-pyruvoyltetrahydropterin/6-carboxytetrahydropterin synthase